MSRSTPQVDWGEASESFDQLVAFVGEHALDEANEAQTRHDIVDRLVREVLGWQHGQIALEERTVAGAGYVDYLLRSGDFAIVVEAKRYGATFPSPTRRRRLKVAGSALSRPDTAKAIKQARAYADDKGAVLSVATNGRTWILTPADLERSDGYATVLFPFDVDGDAEDLHALLSVAAVESGGLTEALVAPVHTDNRLSDVLRDPDGRVDRNNIADSIAPALDLALYSDAVWASADQLAACYVATEGRTKFDEQLGVHLADPRPYTVLPARRVRREKAAHVSEIMPAELAGPAPPVTVLIGRVGAGKSTYLRHFELVAGRQLLHERQAHWINVDFRAMGPGGSPRDFMYAGLRDYLTTDHGERSIDFNRTVGPAYKDDIDGLARGPLAPIFVTDKAEWNRQVASYMQREYEAVEPYVDKVFRYICRQQLVVIVLDNIDLYEDERLESEVFAEGLALSKRIGAHVMVTVRDDTFVRHRADAVFDAYEFRKLWLDAPPFAEVLSARFTYAKRILSGRPARLELSNRMVLAVPDISIFFDIVQSSVLRGPAGSFIDAMADSNVRHGLTLVTNFLTSGHVNADRALRSFIDGDERYRFPFHELFKGAVLSQWRQYQERRADAVNIFDSRLGSRALELARLWIVALLHERARRRETVEVEIAEANELMGTIGASPAQLMEIMEHLREYGLVRTTDSLPVGPDSSVTLTRRGAYYYQSLAATFVYSENVMIDTAIYDEETWQTLVDLTSVIDRESSMAARMRVREQRLAHYLDYLTALEQEVGLRSPKVSESMPMRAIASRVRDDAARAVASAGRQH